MTGQWAVPSGMTGDAGLVRIGPGTIGDEEFTCPAFSAVKARPRVRAKVSPQGAKSKLETFPLGPVMTALNAVEHDGERVEAALAHPDRDGKTLHPGLRQFAGHAVRMYASGASCDEEEPLDPVPHSWVTRKSNGQTWELYAWGRRYQSPDGRLREFRFLRFGRAGERDRDPAQIAIAAFTAAFGETASWPTPWHEPFPMYGASSHPDRVRIVEAGLLDGSRAVLFDGSPEQARSYFERHGREPVRRVAAGGPPRPGSSCAGCKMLTACEAPPKTPGLLQVTGRAAELRTVSVSDLRHHHTCPAQAFLRGLHLPRSDEYSERARLGQAVHGWLETNHTGRVRAACNAHDTPWPPAEWSGGGWHVEGEAARTGARMLAQHADVCPFQHSAAMSDVQVEPQLTFYDTAANAIVLATPDMLYRDDGAWVWRETKTTQQDRSFHDPLDAYPQLALAVLLLSRGAFGADSASPAGPRVELETLRPDSADVELIDPTDPERVSKAGRVIRTYAEPWRSDMDFEARPGTHCQTCPVSQWCPSFPGASAATAMNQGGESHG